MFIQPRLRNSIPKYRPRDPTPCLRDTSGESQAGAPPYLAVLWLKGQAAGRRERAELKARVAAQEAAQATAVARELAVSTRNRATISK